MLVFYGHVGSYALQHLALLLPLVYLKFILARRANLLLDNAFPLLAEEAVSVLTVDILLFAGIAVYAILPFAQTYLAMIYFKYGHPQAELLNEINVFAFPIPRK